MCFKGPDYPCVGDFCAEYFMWCWESSWNGWCVRLLLYMLDCLVLKEFSKNAFQELCKQDGAQAIGFLNILPRTRSCVCFFCKVYLQVMTCWFFLVFFEGAVGAEGRVLSVERKKRRRWSYSAAHTCRNNQASSTLFGQSRQELSFLSAAVLWWRFLFWLYDTNTCSITSCWKLAKRSNFNVVDTCCLFSEMSLII